MDEKKYAAVYYALGVTRGMLDGVLSDEFDLARIQQVLNSTSASEIAKALKLKDLPRQKNSWVDSGSGKHPRLW